MKNWAEPVIDEMKSDINIQTLDNQRGRGRERGGKGRDLHNGEFFSCRCYMMVCDAR